MSTKPKLTAVPGSSDIDVRETLLRFEEAAALCLTMTVLPDGLDDERVHVCRVAERLIKEGLSDTRKLLGREAA